MMHSLPLLLLSAQAAPAPYPPPRFTEANRAARLEQALPEVRRVIEEWGRQRGAPGMAYGAVIDGRPVLLGAWGQSRRDGTAATPDTAFRIASMTKSFTALAVLKLRDEGKLSLEDEAARWIPELARLRYPTADSPVLRVRHLLTHSAGFPEDNPWGDQQLGVPFATLDTWLARVLPFSTAPGTAYEYSNYGFALAGRVVEKASGRSYRDYVETEILKPLGMTNSTLEPAEARNAAVGYRFQSGRYSEEPSLPHGAFGAMGGLVTTARDLAKYVAFQLDAFPPRDGAEKGPVRRASVREMQQLWRYSGLSARREPLDGRLEATAGGYGYGLRISSDCRFGHMVAHGGGLPGFGSYMLWLPEHGVGVFAMTNLTYAGPAPALQQALDVFQRTGALRAREWPVSPALETARQALFQLFMKWNDGDAAKLAAGNLLLDASAPLRQQEIGEAKKIAGENCRLEGPLRAENWLRGEFDLACDRGRVSHYFTLAPTMPPTVQQWNIHAAPALEGRLRAAAERVVSGKVKSPLMAAYGACRLGRVVEGNGRDAVRVRLACERGETVLSLELDGGGEIRRTSFAKPPDVACVP